MYTQATGMEDDQQYINKFWCAEICTNLTRKLNTSAMSLLEHRYTRNGGFAMNYNASRDEKSTLGDSD